MSAHRLPETVHPFNAPVSIAPHLLQHERMRRALGTTSVSELRPLVMDASATIRPDQPCEDR
jgi:hypothetical protein